MWLPALKGAKQQPPSSPFSLPSSTPPLPLNPTRRICHAFIRKTPHERVDVLALAQHAIA